MTPTCPGFACGCVLKSLPAALAPAALRTAALHRPDNCPGHADPGSLPLHLALAVRSYWGAGGVKLGVQFLDTTDAALRARILSHMNAWGAYCNAKFLPAAKGEVRVARKAGDGYWSYLGTDILQVPADQPTMNLDSFSMETSESEYRRVVRHETGHTLGFPHEHMRADVVARIDPQKAYAYFWATQRWDKSLVDNNVLTPLDPASLRATAAADTHSVMCYQLPASITKDGQPIEGGVDIDAIDGQFAAGVYPGAVAPPPPPPPPAPPPPPPPPPAPMFDPGVYAAGGSVWWFTAAGQKLTRVPFGTWAGAVRVAGNDRHVACVPGAGGGPQLVCFDAETGQVTCSLFVPGIATGFRGGLAVHMVKGWPLVRVTADAGAGPIEVDIDPATGKFVWSAFAADAALRTGLGFAWRDAPSPR